jgi:hypothetical protein
MLLRTVYTVSDSGRLDTSELPIEVELAPGVRASLEEEERGLRVVIERQVDASKLEVTTESGWFRDRPDGSREPLPALRIKDDEPPEVVLAGDFVSAITFLSDVPLSLSSRLDQDRFVAETEAEGRLLERLGTDQPYQETVALGRTRTFNPRLEAGNVAALLDRAAGVRLYAEAMKQGTDVARFRELWRVLESAFQSKDDALIDLLSSFPPVQALQFDESELKDLQVLRGRASHAESKAGVTELMRVEHECGQRMGRLKNLVERVILTKASWGFPTTAVNELAALRAYIGPDGTQYYSAS